MKQILAFLVLMFSIGFLSVGHASTSPENRLNKLLKTYSLVGKFVECSVKMPKN